jgi:ABC-type sulfate/molybdate transport systems ATPase subunit
MRRELRGAEGERTAARTHDLGEARELTRRVAVLSRGRLVACGPTAEILGAGDPLALFRGPEVAA